MARFLTITENPVVTGCVVGHKSTRIRRLVTTVRGTCDAVIAVDGIAGAAAVDVMTRFHAVTIQAVVA
jgi:hypothetical protein